MYIFLFILVSFLLIFLIDSIRYGITPTPSSRKVRQKILNALPGEIEGDIAELGSGFGHMALDLADKFPLNTVLSYEKAKVPFWIQKIWLLLKFKRNLILNYKDFRFENLSRARLLFCYLYRDIMPLLSEKFENELQNGSVVISHTFAIEGWKPMKTIYAKDLYQTPIYIYRMGEHKK